MRTEIDERVEAARNGTNPYVICRMPSGWAVLADDQPLKGWSILLPDPVVSSINDMNLVDRQQFLSDMTILGDALLEVTGAYRINYAIFCNQVPALHAHVVPRYISEPDDLRTGPPFTYSGITADVINPKTAEELKGQIAKAISRQLG
jgi:diadenosine tetraphosphate (Ap4A) HIT family hydrolase